MTEQNTDLAVATERNLASLVAALEKVPGVDEDPTERMLQLVEGAASPDDWEKIWDKLPSIKDSEGMQLRVHDIRLRASEFEGAQYYLLLDATDLRTGERIVMSCGSTMTCMQLAQAWEKGWLPLDVEIRGPRKPSKAGFRPLHLHALKPEELRQRAGRHAPIDLSAEDAPPAVDLEREGEAQVLQAEASA